MNRLHPLSAVLMALNRGVTGLFLGFVFATVLAAVFDPVSGFWTVVAAPTGFLLGAAYGVAYYYRFEYELTADTFDLASGVFARRDREIPYHRVQNVDVRQGVLFKLFGLAIVNVETAGGGATEGVLNFVGEDEAQRLQREIRRLTAESKRRRRKGGTATDAESADDLEWVDPDALETGEDRPGEAIDPPGAADPEPAERAEGATGSEPAEGRTEPAEGATDDVTEPIDPDEGPRAVRGERLDDDADLEDGAIDTASGPGDERIDTAAGSGDWAVDDEPVFADEYRTRRLFELTARELLLYSFASFRFAAAAAVFFFAFVAGDSAMEVVLATAQPFGGPETIATGTPRGYAILTLVSLFYGAVLTYVVGAGFTFVSYYGFQLGRAGDDLVYERGLLQNYSGSIPVGKVQSVTITDNPLQRLIGYAGLWVETAGYGPDSSGGSQSAIPLATERRAYRFAERFTDLERPTMERPTSVARRRYLARYSIVAGLFVAAVYGLSTVTPIAGWQYAALAFLAVPPAAHLKWIHLGYYVGENHVVIRSGFWRRQTTVIPYYRVQTINTRRSIFQRRLGLASLVVDTASSQTFFRGTPTVYDADLAVARSIHDDCRERLQTALAKRAADEDAGEIEFD